MDKLFSIATIIISACLCLLIIQFSKNEMNVLKKEAMLQSQIDSLNAELFPCEIELNRHKVAFEIFVRRNPKAAEEYAKIISDETE